MKEIWRDVKDYEGIYQVSNLGRVKSLKHSKEGKILKGRVTGKRKTTKGYVFKYLNEGDNN